MFYFKSELIASIKFLNCEKNFHNIIGQIPNYRKKFSQFWLCALKVSHAKRQWKIIIVMRSWLGEGGWFVGDLIAVMIQGDDQNRESAAAKGTKP